MKNTEMAALALLAALVSPAMAQDSGVSFSHKNGRFTEGEEENIWHGY